MTSPAQLIQGIPPVQDARILQPLSGGGTSELWLLERQNEKFVLRIDRDIIASLSLDREREEVITRVTGDAGIGPELVFSNPEAGLQVVRFIDQPAWSVEDVRETSRLCALAETLARLHRLTAPVSEFDPIQSAEHYVRILENDLAQELAAEIAEYCRELKSASDTRVLCHNDLVHTNILGHDPVMLIDWEFAAMGDAMFDLATVIQHHELDTDARSLLISCYENEGGAFDARRLGICCALYDSLAALWYAARNVEYDGDPPFMAELERALVRRRSSGIATGL